MRNLREKNPPVVDGQLLLAGEMALVVGSTLRLGTQVFKVSAIDVKKVPLGYIDEEITDLPMPAMFEPVTKTVPPQPVIYSQRSRINKKRQPSIISSIPTRKPLMLGISMAAVVSTVGGLVCLNGNTGKTYSEHSFIAQQPNLCRVISPTGGNYLAKLRPEPQTEIGAMKQLNPGEKVLFVKIKGDFVQVRLADGTQGWVFGDQIQRCNISSRASSP